MSTTSTSSTTDKNTKAFPPRGNAAGSANGNPNWPTRPSGQEQAINHDDSDEKVKNDTHIADSETVDPDENGEKEGFYKLQKPFTARANNANTLFEYLPLPTVVTTGTMRKIDAKTDLHFAMQLTALCSGLDAAQMTKISPVDIAGFTFAIQHLFKSNKEVGFTIPKIKTFAAVIPKVTVNQDRAVEFIAQVLENCGMDSDEINALDHRDFAPAIPKIMGMLMDPKA
jgi:hypothetical protein